MNSLKHNKKQQASQKQKRQKKQNGFKRSNNIKDSRIINAQDMQRRVQFRYYTVGSLNPSTVPTFQVFRLNSLYDFDYTLTGKQPYLFDQWALLYAKYQVQSVKVTVTFLNQGGTPALVGMFPTLYSGASYSDVDSYAQFPGAVHRILAVNGNPSVCKFTKTFDIPRFLANSGKDPLSNITSTSSNPTYVVDLVLYSQPADLSTANQVYWTIDAEFISTMSWPTQPGDSLVSAPKEIKSPEDELEEAKTQWETLHSDPKVLKKKC